MSTGSKRPQPRRRKSPAAITAIVEPVPAEIEQEITDRIARFLLLLTSSKEQKPHTPG